MGSEMEDNPGHYYKRRGSLFSVELDGTINKRLSNVSISNGMAWSSDNKEFYYVDTYKFAVEAYDFDISTGDLCESSKLLLILLYMYHNSTTCVNYICYFFFRKSIDR